MDYYGLLFLYYLKGLSGKSILRLFFNIEAGGTEQLLPENTSAPTTTPILADIQYPDGLRTDQYFTYRETPTTVSNKARIKTIKGNTLVWNQLVQNGNFENTSGWVFPNGTGSASNNVLTVTSTAGNLQITRGSNYTLTQGHKIYISCWVKSSVAKNDVRLRISQDNPLANVQYISKNLNANERTNISGIITAESDTINTRFSIFIPNSANGEVYTVDSFVAFDLTKMGLDSITDPSEVNSLFSLPYYDFNQGSLLSFNGTGLKTVGFNQWDEEWEHGSLGNNGEDTGSSSSPEIRTKNYIPILPNTEYYLKTPVVTIAYYYGTADLNDYKGNQYLGGSQILNIPSGTNYIRFRTINTYGDYKNDICLNISDTSRNGEYEPYKESSLSLPISQYFPWGMDGAGTVYDELTSTRYVKRIGQITFDGTQTMVGQDISSSVCKAYYEISNIQPKTYGTTDIDNGLISNYLLPNSNANTNSGESGIHRRIGGQKQICVSLGTSSGVTTVNTFNAYLSAHPLTVYYPLATPLENYGIVDLGTLNWSVSNGVSPMRFETTMPSGYKKPTTSAERNRLICSRYVPKSSVTASNNETGITNYQGLNVVFVRDLTYADVASFKQAMQGVYLLYEKENPQGFTTASLVTENAEIPLSNNDGVLIGKCTEQLSAEPGFQDAKIKLSDSDGECYSNKIQLHIERKPQ